MDGIGIELLVEFARPWMWLGTGRAAGTWASGAAIEAGIAGGMCGGTLTTTETGVEMADFFDSETAVIIAVVTLEDGSVDGSGRTLVSDSSITMTFCDGVALLGREFWPEVVGWALEEFEGCQKKWQCH